MNIPSKIKEMINDRPYSIDRIGKSSSQVICFDDMVLKIEREQEESNNEYKMMEWLESKIPVPKILYFQKIDGVNYLLMSRIEGKMACEKELLTNPNRLVELLCDGLKMLWNVDIANCPINNSIDNKLRQAEIRVNSNQCSIEDAEPATYGPNGFENPKELLQWLKENRPKEKLAFSHGDYCLPNIFIKNDKVSGFIDLGRSGMADIYQDIALCYRSLQHNYYGKYAEEIYNGFNTTLLFSLLDIEPDWDKIRWYILLDELF